jgi:hypothetical protein
VSSPAAISSSAPRIARSLASDSSTVVSICAPPAIGRVLAERPDADAVLREPRSREHAYQENG